MSKKKNVSYYTQKAWIQFSRYIRLRDCIATTGTTTHGKCCTCGEYRHFKGLQAGHFVSGRRNAQLFDEIGVNAQCKRCNYDGGRPAAYHAFMLEKHGEAAIAECMALRWKYKKFTIPELQDLEREYREKADALKEQYE
jgi:hypothetical protein